MCELSEQQTNGVVMEIECRIYTRPDFLDGDFEYEGYVGINHLRNCFKTKRVEQICDPVYKTNTITLSFPERWLNVLEQRSLTDRVKKYYPTCDRLIIKTHSVYIIQTIHKEECFMMDAQQRVITEGAEQLSATMDDLFFKGASKGIVVI